MIARTRGTPRHVQPAPYLQWIPLVAMGYGLLGCGNSSSGVASIAPASGAFDGGPIEVDEDRGRVTLLLTLDAVPTEPLEFNVDVAGTATEGADFTLAENPIRVAAGATTVPIELDIVDDLVDEGVERIELFLDGAHTTVSINDDDPAPIVRFELAGQDVTELDRSVLLHIELSAVSERAVAVPYSFSGKARRLQDYTFDAGPVTILPGTTSTTVDVGLVYDDLLEDTENIDIQLGVPTNARLGSRSRHTLRLIDVEPAPRVVFGQSTLDLPEAAAGVALQVVVEPTGIPAPDLEGDGSERLPYPVAAVHYEASIEGGDTAGFEVGPDVLVLEDGASEAFVTISFDDDDVAEAATRIHLTLTDAEAASLGDLRETDLVVHDDDSGARVVFLAELSAGSSALFADDLLGTQPRTLATFPAGTILEDLRLAPDGTAVAFLSDLASPEVLSLWSIDLATEELVEVSDPLAASTGVLDYQWSPDSAHLAWRAAADGATPIELFSSSRDGTSIAAISSASSAGPPPSAGGNFVLIGEKIADGVLDYAFSPDGSLLAWQADQRRATRQELFVAPASGGAAKRLSGPMVYGGSVAAPGDAPAIAWSPDSEHVAYLADQDVNDQFRLYSARTDASERRELSGAVIAKGDVTEFEWSPSGTQLSFRADANEDERFDLFTTLVDGTGRLLLSDDLPEEGDVRPASSVWSPAGERLLWVADGNAADSLAVFALAGDDDVAKISAPIEPGSAVGRPTWSPDGSRVAYSAIPADGGKARLFLGSPNVGDVQVVTDVVADAERVTDDIQWAPDASRVMFSTLRNSGRSSLYSVDRAGGAPFAVAGPSEDQDGEPIGALWAADATRVVVRARVDDPERFDLSTTRADDLSGSVLLTPAEVGGAGVVWFAAH